MITRGGTEEDVKVKLYRVLRLSSVNTLTAWRRKPDAVTKCLGIPVLPAIYLTLITLKYLPL